MSNEKLEYVRPHAHTFQEYDSNLIVTKQKHSYAGGSLQSDWTDTATLDPVSAWSSEIIGEGLYYSPFAGIVEAGGNLRRANKKQLFWVSKASTSNVSTAWATGVSDVHSYERQLNMDSLYIDPVEYRTNTPVAYETLEEVDMVPIEAYVRKMLAYYGNRLFTYKLYQALDDGTIDGDYDYNDVAGNALAYCNANTADYGTQLTADVLKTGVEAIVADLYRPTDCILPPALYMDLFQESQFVNAAQYGGQNTAITEGRIPRFLGIDFYMDTDMPDDNADADIGLLFDRNFFMGMVVSNTGTIKAYDRWNTGEWDFTLRLKLGCKVLQENAGCAFYT